MALDESSNMVMPVSPMGGYNNNGFGGGWGEWLIVLLLFGMFGNGGWGNGFGGGNQLGYDFPWLLNSNNNTDALITAGFNNQGITSALSGIQSSVTSGFGDVQLGLAGVNQNICQTGNGIVNAINSGFAGVEASANARQIADMQQNFANQTATLQGFNGLQSQLASCCCEQRLGLANLGADIAREACATRTTDTQNTQAILNQVNNGIQSIKDQLCSDKIEQKNDVIAQLRSELMYARGQASQDVQTAAIQAGQRALANEVERYVAPTPIPAYVVANPNGCGCGYGVA